ncbi:NAD-dependent epimerase/dehydratase family protein [Planctomycetota bacterium]
MADRVLVTGGAGFIGLNVARRAVRDGARVTLVDNFERGAEDEELRSFLSANPDVRLIRADLRRTESYELLEGPYDRIFHLAAMLSIQAAARRPRAVLHTNALITLLVCDYWREQGQGALVLTSTSEAYGGLMSAASIPVPTPERVPVGFADVTVPRTSYAASKIFCESYVYHLAQELGLPALIVRPHNVYGPRMGFDHVIPQMYVRLRRREDPFRIFGAEQTRSFCFIDDFVAAVFELLRADCAGVFHVGNDAETRVEELAGLLFDVTGFKPEVDRRPPPEGSPARRCPDISKLFSATGYRPETTLRAGLQETIAWYRRRLEEDPELQQLVATPFA